jgi:hypothetical protein
VQALPACGFVVVHETNFSGNHASGAGGAFFSFGRELRANFSCVPHPAVAIRGAGTASTVGSEPGSKFLQIDRQTDRPIPGWE